MVRADEDALICDMAETYHIYDWRKLPIRYVATLACGLSEDSRIKRKMSGQAAATDMLLKAIIADAVNFIAWSHTEDAKKNKNRPKSIFAQLTKSESEKPSGFDTVEAFEAARAKIINGG